ncbi:MAG: hypothetical protein A2046_07855 [Bacteroidetes bacterium GWA2_30_7]|nr:MAG: hypothetical protein A2046_07855 [Bacteroidetes bacterium GWA2_30_7]
MSIAGYSIIIITGLLMLSPFVLILLKANYHFEYLKIIYPDKFKKYLSYLDTSKNVFFNEHIVLVFPTFKRLYKLESTVYLIKLGNKISLFCKLFYFNCIVLIVYVIVLIVFFGD